MRALTVTTVLALALSGCVAPSFGPSGAVGDAAAAPIAWDMSGCKLMIASTPVSSAAIAPHLPAGFRALTPGEIGLPFPEPSGDAVLGVEAFSCATGPNGTTDAPYANVFTFVEPPAHLLDPAIDFMYFVKWDTLVGDAGMRATLAAAGLPVVDGEVAPGTADQAVGPGYAMQLTLTMDGLTYGLHAATPSPAFDFTGTYAEFSPKADGGLAKWKTTIPPGTMWEAAGYLKLPTEGLAYEIVGKERAPALYYVGLDGAFTNSTIELDVPLTPA